MPARLKRTGILLCFLFQLFPALCQALFLALLIRFQPVLLAEGNERALFAFWFFCRTEITSEKDHIMVSLIPAASIDLSFQLLFDLFHAVIEFCKPEPLADPVHMRIDRKAWNVECHASYDIGRLAPYSSQRLQILIGIGNDAVKTALKILRHRNDVFGLGMVQADRFDTRFHFPDIGSSQCL